LAAGNAAGGGNRASHTKATANPSAGQAAEEPLIKRHENEKSTLKNVSDQPFQEKKQSESQPSGCFLCF
jgi:hypothetical protein